MAVFSFYFNMGIFILAHFPFSKNTHTQQVETLNTKHTLTTSSNSNCDTLGWVRVRDVGVECECGDGNGMWDIPGYGGRGESGMGDGRSC